MQRSDAVALAQQVAAVAGEHADETESLRRLAPAVVDAFLESGLGGLVAPSALGGDAAEPSIMAEVVEVIARKDASAAWCVGIGSGTNYLSGLVPKDVAKNCSSMSNNPELDLSNPSAGPC